MPKSGATPPNGLQRFFEIVQTKMPHEAKCIIGSPGNPRCAQVRAIEVDPAKKKMVVESAPGSHQNLIKQLASDPPPKVTIYHDNVPHAVKCISASAIKDGRSVLQF